MTSPVRRQPATDSCIRPRSSGTVRVHDARCLGVGPHDDGHRRRRSAARRPARPRTGRRRRRRLLLSRPAFLPAHVALPTSSAAAITFGSSQFPSKPAKIPEPLAALAPLEVAARGRVDPGRLVALSTNIFVLLRDDGAAAADRRHWWRCGRCDGFLTRYGLLRRSLTTDHHSNRRIAPGLRWPRYWWSPPRIRTWLSSTHDAVPSAPCLRPRVVHERIIGRGFPP